jgi:hypothetical protein
VDGRNHCAASGVVGGRAFHCRDRTPARDFKERRGRQGASARPCRAAVANPPVPRRRASPSAGTPEHRSHSASLGEHSPYGGCRDGSGRRAPISHSGSAPELRRTRAAGCAQHGRYPARSGSAPRGSGAAPLWPGHYLLLADRRARNAEFPFLRGGIGAWKTILRGACGVGVREGAGSARRRGLSRSGTTRADAKLRSGVGRACNTGWRPSGEGSDTGCCKHP